VPLVTDVVVGRGVSIRYGDAVAVAESDFGIPAGKVTALIGPNGSGKSTLLGAIAGLIAPATGTLTVLGHPAGAERRRIAYVLQSTKVNDAMPVTVAELVAMGRYAALGPFGRFTPSDRAVVKAAMARMDVTGLANRHLSELSGGQRQRVFVAQGLAQEHDLLLLDEPLTGLDIVSAETIDAVIHEEQAAGRTVLLTTHDLTSAQVSDHVLLMGGRIVASGPPSSVLTGDNLVAAYGSALMHIEEGRMFLDDPAHISAAARHVHIDRATGTHHHDEP
jgi:manganese transport system ATP-binding protein